MVNCRVGVCAGYTLRHVRCKACVAAGQRFCWRHSAARPHVSPRVSPRVSPIVIPIPVIIPVLPGSPYRGRRRRSPTHTVSPHHGRKRPSPAPRRPSPAPRRPSPRRSPVITVTKRASKAPRANVIFTNMTKLPPGCVDMSHLKKYRERPGPPFPGNKCRGVIMPGNDLLPYVSRSSGRADVYRWFKV